MNFKINIGAWNSVFAVPSVLVDKHIKLASKEQLKVILFLLRHSGEAYTSSEIASALAISEESAEEAVEYWVQNELLSMGEDLTPAGASETPSHAAEKSPASKPAVTEPNVTVADAPKERAIRQSKRLIRPDSMYVATRINESAEMKYLMQETENTLGKTISPALSSILVAIHEDFGLPVEVIVIIIHYAKSVGKTSTSYIESVARDWAENDINTLNAAENKLKELDEKKQAWKKIETIFGIPHRAPTPKEEGFAFMWVREWAMPKELILDAYHRCVDKTGKLSMPYINKILDKWHKLGAKTLSDIEKSEERATKKEKSYDIDEFENTSFFNPID